MPIFGITSSGVALTNATGGTEVISGGYKYHTFTATGTLTFSVGGTVEVLCVSGGGGGGSNGGTSYAGGGGGAGGLKYSSSVSVSAQSYAVTVGAGGLKGNSDINGKGSASSFGSTLVSSTGGGYGGKGDSVTATAKGGDGGSAGGGGGTTGASGSATSGEGSAGGAGNGTGGGGGGGASGTGGQAVNTGPIIDGGQRIGGQGGIGSSSYSVWASATSTGYQSGYSGGGPGGGISTASAYPTDVVGSVGANTGGGGRGRHASGATTAWTDGNSGIVIIRYPA